MTEFVLALIFAFLLGAAVDRAWIEIRYLMVPKGSVVLHCGYCEETFSKQNEMVDHVVKTHYSEMEEVDQ